MNNIQQFIQQHCPDGVPFKKLGDVCEVVTAPSTGLPAEIKMRRAQYEYYGNKLLTFEKY